MSSVRSSLCKLINAMRFDFAVQREKDRMLKRANEYLRSKYGDRKRIL